jgi:erythronate-4-phosphate dehydrogenase
MIKVVADNDIPFLKGVLEPYSDIKYLPGKHIDRNVISDLDAILIRTRTRCTGSFLEGSGLKFIGTATIGFDHIDTGYCNSHNIKWINAPGCNSSSVSQYMTAALLRISQEFRFSLKEKTIGIIGVGNVGSKVEKVAKILGMKVLLNDPPRARKEGKDGFTSLSVLLRKSDIITLHVPLTIVGVDKTYHMINDKTLKKVRKGTWLINTSRGEIVDSASLKKNLDSGRLAGLVSDVWENEPDIDTELLHSTFIATPHIAGYSLDGKANGTSVVVNEFSRFFGLPLKNWYPEKLPEPHSSTISINGNGKSPEDIIRSAVEHTYDISKDDKKLRSSPADFEKWRNDYPDRREFPAFRITNTSCPEDSIKILKELGFSF